MLTEQVRRFNRTDEDFSGMDQEQFDFPCLCLSARGDCIVPMATFVGAKLKGKTGLGNPATSLNPDQREPRFYPILWLIPWECSHVLSAPIFASR